MLPDDVERCDIVINRAIDVRAACMRYLASHIRHDVTPLGAVGNIIPLPPLIDSGKVTKTIFRGEQITNITSQLKSAVDSYNNALGNINLRINIKVYELLKGVLSFRYSIAEHATNNLRYDRLENSK